MSEPSDEELERAERIRKLRSGGARSRGHEMRERRREANEADEAGTDDGAGDDPEAGDDGDAVDDTEADEDAGASRDEASPAEGGSDEPEDGRDEIEQDAGEGEGADDEPADSGPGLSAGGEVDVLSMAAALPEDGSLFVVPVREGLRREFNKVAEQLHLRYGFEYGRELDADQHVRPLALYLGVRALEDTDVEVVKELLASVDDLDGPDSDSG